MKYYEILYSNNDIWILGRRVEEYYLIFNSFSSYQYNEPKVVVLVVIYFASAKVYCM